VPRIFHSNSVDNNTEAKEVNRHEERNDGFYLGQDDFDKPCQDLEIIPTSR
jgi:hypothetical protein